MPDKQLLSPISICSIASISALGQSSEEVLQAYRQAQTLIRKQSTDAQEWVAKLTEEGRAAIENLRNLNPHYKNLDPSVLYAVYASRQAMNQCSWDTDNHIGINIGSSRGATQLFETYHSDFLNHQSIPSQASPTTTLGNISSWVAQDLHCQGPVISHSITCSTALHALINGIAWLRGGMADRFIVGGSEAALTPFTIAQMKALRIYSKEAGDYPCRPLDFDKKNNTMVLGEGAAVACIEQGIAPNHLAIIEGIGYATEKLEHNVSISTNADCFQASMKMALQNVPIEAIDVVVMHAPGTRKGDQAEWNAVKKIFDNKIPAITSNKWKIGHTFAASGMLSIELAIIMLQTQQFIGLPYLKNQKEPKKINKVLVNAVGFGGNAVSILLSDKSSLNKNLI